MSLNSLRTKKYSGIENQGITLTFCAPGPIPWAGLSKDTMKRIILLIVTNLAVMLVLGIVASLLGVNRFLTANGLNLTALLGFAAIMGFGGAFISLWISKPMAKWSTGAQVITQPQSPDEAWLLDTVRQLSQRAGLARVSSRRSNPWRLAQARSHLRSLQHWRLRSRKTPCGRG